MWLHKFKFWHKNAHASSALVYSAETISRIDCVLLTLNQFIGSDIYSLC